MNIKMVSTRDVEKSEHSYTDVLLKGLASDGGLYIPTEYPTYTVDDLVDLKGSSYSDIVFSVKQKLVGGAIPDEELKNLIEAAYAENVFDRVDGQIVPVVHIENGLHVQNLSFGPTASFKDMALQLLGQEMNYELNQRNENLVILGATSGDTGSAAEAAVKGLKRIKLLMLSPEEGMSSFQKAQMGKLTGGNIFNISVRGRFDDCQDLVKETKQDKEFAHLGAVNSINWGRISSQVPYYFSGYFQVAKRVGNEVDFVVPSGNFGNMLSAYIAKKMGVPIRQLIVATNENDVLDTLFKTGLYKRTPTQVTSSPSMDISKASNYERLVFDLLQGDAEKVAKYMEEFNTTGQVHLKDYGLDSGSFKEREFHSDSSTHQDRISTIKHVHEVSGEIIDPHTADAVSVGYRYKDANDSTPIVCMGTALPVKFEDTIKEALGFVPERTKRFVGLEENLHKDSFDVIDTDAEQLKDYIRKHI